MTNRFNKRQKIDNAQEAQNNPSIFEDILESWSVQPSSKAPLTQEENENMENQIKTLREKHHGSPSCSRMKKNLEKKLNDTKSKLCEILSWFPTPLIEIIANYTIWTKEIGLIEYREGKESDKSKKSHCLIYVTGFCMSNPHTGIKKCCCVSDSNFSSVVFLLMKKRLSHLEWTYAQEKVSGYDVYCSNTWLYQIEKGFKKCEVELEDHKILLETAKIAWDLDSIQFLEDSYVDLM
jgi:hypothetical protein